jgi:hypothetical protein
MEPLERFELSTCSLRMIYARVKTLGFIKKTLEKLPNPAQTQKHCPNAKKYLGSK